jgi:hypothetical protein
VEADLHRALFPRRTDWRHPTFADLVLELGTEFQPVDWPGSRRQGPPGRCFANATEYAEATGAIYVEGYVLTRNIPHGFEHAWCATQAGAAIDPSIPDGGALAYLGVAVAPDYQRAQQVRRGTTAVFTCDGIFCEYNEVALSRGVPADAVAVLPTR